MLGESVSAALGFCTGRRRERGKGGSSPGVRKFLEEAWYRQWGVCVCDKYLVVIVISAERNIYAIV